MKWLLLALWMALCPVVTVYLKQNPRHMRWAAFAMGFAPIMMNVLHLYVAPISRGYWLGPVKGIEISALDFLAIAVIFATPRTRVRLTILWPWFIYIAAVLIAVPQATFPQVAFYYVWQLLRAALLFYAAARLAPYPKAIESLLWGLFAAIGYQSILALMQSDSGILQAGGSVGSQNMLGMFANFALCTSLALLLRGRHGWWPVFGFGGALVVDVLTASRATLGFGAIGMGVLLVLSCSRSFTPRKGAILGLVALTVAAATPVALGSIAERKSGNSTESSNHERQAFKTAAWMIIDDHPLGVGSNHYGFVANMGGYSARAGVAWNAGSRSTSVHDTYLLVLAETGVAGLIGLFALLFNPIFATLRGAFRHRRDPRGELLLGTGVAVITFSLHLNYEWIFVVFNIQYIFAMVAGCGVGLALLLDKERAERVRAERLAARAAPKSREVAIA